MELESCTDRAGSNVIHGGKLFTAKRVFSVTSEGRSDITVIAATSSQGWVASSQPLPM